MIFVLDASAMIAYLRGETGGGEVVAVLLDPNNQCLAHALNLCEVFYDFQRVGGIAAALEAIHDLLRVGVIQNFDVGGEFWQAAASVKAVHRRVSLADCFAITLTNKLGGTLLTADHHELDSLAAQGVCAVQFFRRGTRTGNDF